jgi:EAL domain-containing protein (putative c-di-GMP-specific phosphodiesterase class I)/FixJ family two-component response regulator
MTGRIRVLLAEDEAVVREALGALVRGEADLELVGAATDAQEAIDLARALHPDVAVVDVRMPAGGGPRAARDIRVASPQTRVLALSAHDDRASVLEMLRAGSVGYLVKGASAALILDGIRNSASGQGALSAEVAGDVIQALKSQLIREDSANEERRFQMREIRQVVDGHGLWMVFQPIFALTGPRLTGMEALARFDSERVRPPTSWFERAASLGMLVELEMTAARAALARIDRLPEASFLSINVSPATATSPQFVATMAESAAHRVVIEITEHARVDDYDRLNRAMSRLRSMGVRLAVDDAGAGFASLQHIVRLSPDFIKLDIALTRGIGTDPVRRALATALISFASEIGADIIAEGIETEEEFETLHSLGAAYGQGYFLGTPASLPGEESLGPIPFGAGSATST